MRNILIVGANSYLAKYFIKENSKKFNITSISISKKSIYFTKKKKFFYLKKIDEKQLLKFINPNSFHSIIFFHSYGTKHQKNLKKLENSNFRMPIFFFNFFKLQKKVVKFIYFGSVSEYNNFSKDLYAKFKNKTRIYLKKNARKFNIQTIILQLFYIYGPNENKHRLFSLIKSKIISNKKITINNPDQDLDFLHVDDFSKALAKVINKKLDNDFYQYKLCYGKKYKIRKVVNYFKYKNINFSKQKTNIVNYNISGSKKFNLAVRWKPKINIKQGINGYIA
jgi:nucleoside-diphosphate-sugar epimerase